MPENVPMYVPIEDLDQPVHSCSLIRIFTGFILDSQGCSFFMQTRKTDLTPGMCRLI